MAKKLAVIVGATGAQGGSAVNALLESGNWDVRAITRNVQSDKAKELESKGASVVAADLNDIGSLEKAFSGANAVFGVTNFWEMMFTGKSQKEAGEIEHQQSWNLAVAASKTTSLEHYIWSTLPHASKVSNGKCHVAHFDYKAEVDSRIKKELPELAKKTTYLWYGYYTQNWVNFPMFKPLELPMVQKYIWLGMQDPKSVIPVTGDMRVNSGVFIRQILAHPEKTHTKYLTVKTSISTWEEQLADWSAVVGKQAEYVQVPDATWLSLWGPIGQEISDQFKFGEAFSDWETASGESFVEPEEIGIKKGDLISNKEALESLKSQLL